MNSFVRPVNPPPRPGSSLSFEEIDRRKKRLMAILNQGLPTLPNYVLDLNVLLSSPSVNLKKVGAVIRTDPSLSAQVLRLCNSALFGLRRRVISIEQAAVLLGTERLRTLVLTCSVMQFAGKRIPADQMAPFWQHSFLSALLSERIAQKVDYFEKEQAYLGGLLHDIGQLPLWILIIEEEAKRRTLPPSGWVDDIATERDYFGMDHCKVGRWMAVAWNFMPSFVDVFEHHHNPDRAQHDPYLVGIVAAADQFLHARESTEAGATPDQNVPPEAVADPNAASFLQKCLPLVAETERQAVLEMLQTEYVQLLPLVQLGLATVTTGTTSGANQSKLPSATEKS
jgi:HD-like signal output (HDOD) protein